MQFTINHFTCSVTEQLEEEGQSDKFKTDLYLTSVLTLSINVLNKLKRSMTNICCLIIAYIIKTPINSPLESRRPFIFGAATETSFTVSK